MAKTAVINIRTDVETKKAIEGLYSSFGITVSDAVNIFFKKSLMESGLPFKMKKEKKPNKELLEAIKEANEICDNPHLYEAWTTEEEIRKGMAKIANEI
jgi:DNA-damage-inducible protein J